MKPSKNQTHEYIKNRLIDYITSKPYCDLRWIIKKIRLSGIDPIDLANIFLELRTYVDKDEFKTIFDICRNAKFNYNDLK